jgi:hypothetical protein
MIPSGVQTTAVTPPAAAPATAVHDHGSGFHAFLSAINPLQYLPVVGTIYRAVTGDVIPEAVRDGGSLLVSGLLGGPIGLITYIATTIAEKVTGIDPEKIAARVLNPPLAPPTATPAQPAPAVPAEPPAAVPAEPPAAVPAEPSAAVPTEPSAAVPADPSRTDPVDAIAPARRALTAEQLAAYGVRSNSPGTPKLGSVEGADVLNLMELTRLGRIAAYAANQPPPLPVAAAGG